jgi:hypothetical protein
MYMYVIGISFASFYDFPLDFGTVPRVWYIFSRVATKLQSAYVLAKGRRVGGRAVVC